MKKLKQLLKDFPVQQIKGSKETIITGVCANSKLVAPGNLFIAKKGKSHDGTRYIPEAVAAGASAILTDIFDPSLKSVVQMIHPNVNQAEAALAAQYYDHPSRELFMVGITGTNGKTTTTFIIKYLLDQLDGLCGLIGTIEYILGMQRYQATHTTPDVVVNHKLLREMITQGCQSAVMEVSSHALDQGRVDHIEYDVAVFSNLTLDHLDYHQSMENYCLAKNKLFRSLDNAPTSKACVKTAVVNADSPWASHIVEGCQAAQITYGIENNADLQASDICLGKYGTELNITYKGQKRACAWPLIGRFNVYNCLSAIAVALCKGLDFVQVIEKMKQLPAVRGRLEPVRNALNLKIFVDFAHSDDALINILQTLTELKTARIITVFGCGGDRDYSKRPKMAAASECYSDFSIVTSDNPRSEDPLTICHAIAKGFQKQSYEIEPNRYFAIQRAIEMAHDDDIILIAGKGHESYQVFSHQTIEFDDCKVASEICSKIKR
jgi:UDP-N-acetylmuramoyl-L-alanyl-D-glutamate--2,6-diaminopimelate ligase